jgi:arylsulfatase A-like enzyme
MATSAPGYSSVRPKDKSPVSETLKSNGYPTAQFGKCHEVPVWEVSPVGPFQQWPTGTGFEYFYGLVGGRPTSTIRGCSKVRGPCRRRERRLHPVPHGNQDDCPLGR